MKEASVRLFACFRTPVGMFYIRRGETPVLKIKLPEYTVFVNSEESGKVQEWYEELSS